MDADSKLIVSYLVGPSMEAGLTHTPWTIADLVVIMPETAAKKRRPYKPHKK